ncbi:MAG: phospho-N-acetylmuramoyl-pentapeptide-transferase [Bacteroidetes bacterium]|nr:phospho-N-acetylmuramoyl-pentapeptide-transferase [Bacteroidota bacterium]MBU1116557.1 phospho-N-acetylmuramoyl-pentapeptide-transferase [Bacteroidota bacterium]MBU1797553.1 phospho-N-acetylmuramoyl-pentapeptide-transferase [Bacteroidota bacterium]
MFYYLFDYLNQLFDIPGFGIFKYLSFRSSISAITALAIAFYIGPKIIAKLQRLQVGETIRENGPQTHMQKAGTPTMGGLIILLAIVVPVLLWSDITSTYILLALFGLIFLGFVGFADDYLKVVKKYSQGLIARYKLLGQIIVGLVVGSAIYFLPEFAEYNTQTTIPFFKNLNWDFGYLYIPVVIFIITATSNAVNLTDGLDGLAMGTVTFVMLALAIMSYVSGNVIWADYLNIVYLPGSGELTVFIAAIIGAGLGFLWFNFYPAQVFMGDTGSLALGGVFGIIAILIKKELLIPLLGGIFFVETLSVILQRTYFKYTKKRYGVGKRIFKMSPIHHHFELVGWAEPKIVMRFYIITIILVIVSLASFKVR